MVYIALGIVCSVFIICCMGVDITITHKHVTDEVRSKPQHTLTQEELDELYKKEPEYSFDNVLAEVQKILDADLEDNG